MMKITNISDGPRGINTTNGPVLLDPKGSLEADVFQRESEHIAASGWFTLEGEFTPNPGEAVSPPMNDGLVTELRAQNAAKDATIADLRDQLAARDKTLNELQEDTPKSVADVLALFDDPNVHFMTAKREAAKILGADAPSTKDEIIAALKAKV